MTVQPEQIYSINIPKLAYRLTGWALLSFAVNVAEALFRPRIFVLFEPLGIASLYLLIWSIFVMTFTFAPLAGLVVCYCYQLRQRRLRSNLSELGLAARAVVAGLAALLLFVLAVAINDGVLTGT